MAIVLNGVDQGVDLGTPAGLDIRSRPIAFCATFTTTTASGFPFVVHHGRASGTNEWRIVFTEGVLEMFWAHIGGMHTQPQPQLAVNDGQSHRVLYYVEAAGLGDTVTYVDGVEVTREANVDSTDGATTIVVNDISSIGYNSADDTFWFPGEIADVAVWDTEPSPADAAALTGGTVTPADLPIGLRGYWPLTSDARDAGPNGIHGTLVGSPTFTEAPAAAGQLDTALPSPTVDVAAALTAAAALTVAVAAPVADLAAATVDAGVAATVDAVAPTPVVHLDATAAATGMLAAVLPPLSAALTTVPPISWPPRRGTVSAVHASGTVTVD